MLNNHINPNPFTAINPQKLLHYRFVKRIRQTFNVFYGGFDREFDRHVGMFDWATFGIPLLIKWGFDVCHAEAHRTSPLFYIPYAALGLPHLIFKGARIVFSAVMMAISFLGVMIFHGVAELIKCCIDPKTAKRNTEMAFGSTASIEKTVGGAAHALGRGVSQITRQVQSPADRGQAAKDKVRDVAASGKQSISRVFKGAAHKAEKETKKMFSQGGQRGFQF